MYKFVLLDKFNLFLTRSKISHHEYFTEHCANPQQRRAAIL